MIEAAAREWLIANHTRLSEFNQRIFEFAEPAWREYRASAAYVELLREEGFDVEAGSAGIPTAFSATWGSGRPLLASYAEYDAVPGFNQKAVPYRAGRDGTHPLAPGDPDPHSALGTAALGAVLAAKAAMERHHLRGTLRFFGQPAEKMEGAKAFHAAQGYYDDLDAVLAYHPEFTNTVQWEIQSAPFWSCVFTFTCADVAPRLDPATHVLDEHQIATRSPGALDAVCLMYSTTKATQDQILPRTEGWTISENILHASQATADNLASGIGHIQYVLRALTLESLQVIYDSLAANARHVASVTGCEVYVRWVTKTRAGLFNEPLAQALYDNLIEVGAPIPGPRAVAFGREVQRTLGFEAESDPFLPEGREIRDPRERDAEWRAQLPPWQTHFTWDDYVELSWHAPTARLFTGKPVLRHARSWSHWSGHALNGVPEAIDPTWSIAALVLSRTLLQLIEDPDLLARAQRDFERRTGGGIGGSDWIAPLLPRDTLAPVDLPWPEYVTTARGDGWRLPWPLVLGDPL